MKKAIIAERIQNKIVPIEALPENVTKISYSQYSIFKSCPYRWYTTYGKRNFLFTSSIDTVFGTALHETLQEYLNLLFNHSVKASESFPYVDFLYQAMRKAYKEEKVKNDNKHFTSPEIMDDYYNDGLEIMRWIKSNRLKLFDTKNMELVGIEIPILLPLSDIHTNIWFQGFLDIVLYDKVNKIYIIIDVKTSKQGWNDYAKKDITKITQLLLYKNYFSRQFGVPEEMIDIQFMICKRKLWDKSEFPLPRVQKFIPANGKVKVKEAVSSISNFIHECFDYDGKVIDKKYDKVPGKNENNCRFCPFNGSEFCDKKN